MVMVVKGLHSDPAHWLTLTLVSCVIFLVTLPRVCVFILRSLLSSDKPCAGPQGCQRCETDLALVLRVMKLGSGEAKKQTDRQA